MSLYTDIRFVNRSLNPNVHEVGVFLGDVQLSSDRFLSILRCIRKCSFLWEHPIRIYWSDIKKNVDRHVISFCADVRSCGKEEVKAKYLNKSLTSFNLYGLKEITIYMKGGEPGPTSSAIMFYEANKKAW